MKNKLAGRVNIIIGVLMIVYYVVMFVLTALGTYVPKESENWEGLGYAVGLVFLLLLFVAGLVLAIVNCVLSCIAGKKLFASAASGRIPKVLMIVNGVFKTLNLLCLILVVALLTGFPDVVAYIAATVLMILLIAVSVATDCMVRAVRVEQSSERKPDSYGFDYDN